jgi:cytochrome c peroxidase
MGTEWQSYDSPFDAYLAGDDTVLGEAARNGKDLFYGKAHCSRCHSGSLFSDQEFHALNLPQFGPGRTRPFDPMPRDFGRMGKTDNLDDAYRFRTPMLRNIALTGPYGHNGAYPTLNGIIRHHVDLAPIWTRDMAQLPSAVWIEAIDFAAQNDRLESLRHARFRDTVPILLKDSEVDDLVHFLNALTGATVSQPTFGVPSSVPSGLPLD